MTAASRDVLIQTPDIEAAAVFYIGLLGLTEFMRKTNMIGLEAGAFRLFLDRGPPYGPVFDFHVADLETAKSELVKAGCRIDQEDRSIPRCYVRDPFGLTFNIEQRQRENSR